MGKEARHREMREGEHRHGRKSLLGKSTVVGGRTLPGGDRHWETRSTRIRWDVAIIDDDKGGAAIAMTVLIIRKGVGGGSGLASHQIWELGRIGSSSADKQGSLKDFMMLLKLLDVSR